MKLVHATLRPARVIEVLDQGKIKVEAPGKFAEADKDNLPPVYPFFGQHANSYSSVNVDDEVWLLSCSDNKRQLHWIRKDNFEEEDKDLINGKNVDILMNRSSGISRAILMFDDENGWLIQNGPGSIRMSNDGSIYITSGDTNRGISITPSGISFGTSGASNHTACFGDETQKAMECIYALFEALKLAAGKSAYTAHLVPAIESQIKALNDTIPNITSVNVTMG